MPMGLPYTSSIDLDATALPLVEIELPWNPPSLTQIPPMYLFGGLITLVFVALVLLYFYEPKASTEN